VSAPLDARSYAAVALGGSLGGLAREWVLLPQVLLPLNPMATLLLVNSAGSVLIGLVFAFSEPGGRRRLPPRLSLGLIAGFCGAFTTFSLFAVESTELWRAAGTFPALVRILVAPVCWLSGAAVGLALGRRMNRPRHGAAL
jgi:CrcB protein